MTSFSPPRFMAFLLFLLYAVSHIQAKNCALLPLSVPSAFADGGDDESDSEEETNDDFLEEQTAEDDVIEDIDDAIEENEQEVLEEIMNDDEEEEDKEETDGDSEDELPNLEDIQAFDGADNQAAADANIDNNLR